MRRVGLVVVGVVVVFLAALWALQRQLIYLPDASRVPPASSVLPGARDVVLETDDGLRLGAWYVAAEPPARDVAVLVANGNAGNRSYRAGLASALAERGLSVLLFDYRGYGGNPGSPSEDGLARDVRAAHRFLTDDIGVPPDRIVYFGESLGAAVVTELATQRPPAALVLRSPFVDLASVGRVHYPFLPVGLLLRDRFPLVRHLVSVKAPVTVVYGSEDGVVPPTQSQAVAKAAPRLLRVIRVEGADHNDPVLVDGDEVVAAVVEAARRR